MKWSEFPLCTSSTGLPQISKANRHTPNVDVGNFTENQKIGTIQFQREKGSFGIGFRD